MLFETGKLEEDPLIRQGGLSPFEGFLGAGGSLAQDFQMKENINGIVKLLLGRRGLTNCNI
jgi:hypothetical protein